MTEITELLEREFWRPITDTEGAYEVSDFGRVRSMFLRSKHGTSMRREQPLILKPGNTGRYMAVSIRLHGARFTKSVHVLVAEAFLGTRPNGAHAAHIDGNSFNNRVENLIWATPKENEAHKVVHGTRAWGSRHGIAKLTEVGALDIKQNYRKGNGAALSTKHGVSIGVVVSVAHGRSWKHV